MKEFRERPHRDQNSTQGAHRSSSKKLFKEALQRSSSEKIFREALHQETREEHLHCCAWQCD
jgi:hypothetical protein